MVEGMAYAMDAYHITGTISCFNAEDVFSTKKNKGLPARKNIRYICFGSGSVPQRRIKSARVVI
jgi:hypothetical protein